MKKQKENTLILILLGVALFVLLVVLFVLIRIAARTPEGGTSCGADKPQKTEERAIQTPAPTVLDIYAYYDWTETTQICVYDHRMNERRMMDLEAYIVGVVAAEMPARYEYEALKAQAVASRTYTLYGMVHGGCHTDPEADVCTNSKCCQAYTTRERMQQNWGDEYVKNYNRVAQAVMDTAGEVIVYDGKLCDALYHACSGGQTENSENVYANAIPYLRGVESPYEDPMREEDVEFGYEALAELIAAQYAESGITADNARDGIAIASSYDSGRVREVRLGRTTVTGKQARNLFGLKSTMFTFQWTNAGLTIHTKGYGHGVGLSQNGANGMAKHGSNYREILSHYYTGVSIAAYGADGVAPSVTPASDETGILFVPEG